MRHSDSNALQCNDTNMVMKRNCNWCHVADSWRDEVAQKVQLITMQHSVYRIISHRITLLPVSIGTGMMIMMRAPCGNAIDEMR